MCRSIRPLFNFEPPAMDEEIRAAALQFVRKISGFAHPSRANEAAFASAVAEIASSASRLIASLHTNQQPRDRGQVLAGPALLDQREMVTLDSPHAAVKRNTVRRAPRTISYHV